MVALVTVPFHGDTLFAVRDGVVVRVAIKPISDRLGLDWSSQHKRIKRDAILSEGMAMMTIPSPGGAQETATLPLDLLPGWLFGIDVSRVKPECRDLVLTHQRECHGVLYRHFFAPSDAKAPAPFADPIREEAVSVRRGLVSEARQTFGVRAAGKLWFALGLPVVPEMRESDPQSAFGFTYTAVPAVDGRHNG